MYEFWAKQRGSNPPAYSPVEFYENGAKVVLGMTLLTDEPPGEVVGEFWFEAGGLEFSLNDRYHPPPNL